MKFHQCSTVILGIFGTVLSLSASAQAASFQTNATVTNGAVGDIWLDSITQNGVTFNNFSFVKSANIVDNAPIILDPTKVETSTPGKNANNTGGISTDKGDKASSPMPVSGLNNPTNAEVAAFLGNKNLSNIIDTEDNSPGKNSASFFTLDLAFDTLIKEDGTGLDSLFFWERGFDYYNPNTGNSDLGVQAIDENGNLVGNFIKLKRSEQTYAGFSLDTTEIGETQKVGSWGVNLAQLGVSSFKGIRLSADNGYNGPDFKVVARSATAKTPEPATLLGLGVVFGAASLVGRRSQKRTSH